MFIAMNRFKIETGSEGAFETLWKERESHLKDTAEFEEFKLLRGPVDEEGGYTLYASHTTWSSRAAFEAWTKSVSFRKAHENAGKSDIQYLGHPQLETFETVDGTFLSADAA
ncbi:antibiotic biosynthesis monooxygenase family protein [Hoeflea prorocentri]|uniref:Antibiotic biosynthesis monooxygenase n=1 Tax=Hoeflea prorocentri TaxID=1922333 RepID=A0A9X3UJ65_9HYPH|nr:antibiotic biosynthesis monooxygenase [Hoeflea prorocentri]MCY6379686.1 antibiotic biosynthesis monooxygenase [Hoeflea prorocentri]MDA5397486.1 antibiotic biosynthesis monooxygenase [Hoeflea prorocentri]